MLKQAQTVAKFLSKPESEDFNVGFKDYEEQKIGALSPLCEFTDRLRKYKY